MPDRKSRHSRANGRNRALLASKFTNSSRHNVSSPGTMDWKPVMTGIVSVETAVLQAIRRFASQTVILNMAPWTVFDVSFGSSGSNSSNKDFPRGGSAFCHEEINARCDSKGVTTVAVSPQFPTGKHQPTCLLSRTELAGNSNEREGKTRGYSPNDIPELPCSRVVLPHFTCL